MVAKLESTPAANLTGFAASISRSSENWMVSWTRPVELTEFIESMPAIAENSFSRIVATVEAMVSGLAPGKDVRAVEDKLLRAVPAAFRQHAHHWLILHGRYVCKARKPDCPVCLIRDLCAFKGKTA